jgi:TolB-like protein
MRLGILFGLGMVLVLISILGFTPNKLRQRLGGTTRAPEIRALAVLPLQNLSGDPSEEYFADGITEELITELSHIRELRIISSTSSRIYKNEHKPLPQIARELGVNGIVEGSVLRSGDRVRISAQLIYAPEDRNVWAETYDRDVRDTLTLQANVAGEIVRQVHSALTPDEKTHLNLPRPVNLAALDAYLKGQYHMRKWGTGGSPEERYKAAEYFRQATQIDPGFAQAWVRLADSHFVNAGTSPKEASILKDVLEKALIVDPNLSEAHQLMGRFHESHDWNFTAAEKEYRRAIELDPNSASAHDLYGGLLNISGRWPEAEGEEQLAQTLDPNNDHLFDGLYCRGTYDRALGIALSLAEFHPEAGENYWYLSNVYFSLGRYDEGIAPVTLALRQFGYPEMARALAQTYAADGYRAALQLWAKDLARVQGNPASPTMVARIYLLLGDNDETFKWLERGFTERDGFLPELKECAEWRSLRSDPRFADLVGRIGLPQ